MGFSSGTNSVSEQELRQQVMEERKRKRLVSNRESARRSRMKKQKRLSDLVSQLSEFSKEKNQIIASLNVTTQHCINIEAENSVLMAQMFELGKRLEYLKGIINYLSGNTSNCIGNGETGDETLSYLCVNQAPSFGLC